MKEIRWWLRKWLTARDLAIDRVSSQSMPCRDFSYRRAWKLGYALFEISMTLS
jgi:hypothetical protein